MLRSTTTGHAPGPTLTTGERDAELSGRLTDELVASDTAATGAAGRGAFSVRVTDGTGELAGGPTAWTWGGPCGTELL